MTLQVTYTQILVLAVTIDVLYIREFMWFLLSSSPRRVEPEGGHVEYGEGRLCPGDTVHTPAQRQLRSPSFMYLFYHS